MSVNRLVVAAVLIHLVGCVTLDEKRAKLEQSLSDKERAYFVGKYSVQCKPNSKRTKCNQSFNSISLQYVSNDEKKFFDTLSSVNGSMFGGDSVYDEISLEEEQKSFYFCRILPAGNYSLNNIRYWNFANGGSGYYLNDEDQFDIPFGLEAKKIVSLGGLKLKTATGKNMLGMPLAVPGGLELSSISTDELALAIQKCPAEAQDLEVITRNLWQESYDSPYVMTKD